MKSFSFQVLNITAKYRPRVSTSLAPSISESFPATWESGFKPAFAGGFSQSINWFDKKNKKHSISAIGGVFLGLSTTKLDNNSTRNPVYNLSRNALTVSRGLFFSLGYQKWDIGYAFGWDKPYGEAAESWVYYNEQFHAIIIGFDIVKGLK